MMQKKSQVAGQIFISILAAILAILIIEYGYRAISSFTSRTEDIALAELTTKLQSEIRTIASSHDVRRLDLRLPSRYEKLCLTSQEYPIELRKNSCLCNKASCSLANEKDYNLLICDAWTTENYDKNAFLIPIRPIKITTTIEMNNGYICLEPEGGVVSLRLEGMGDRAKASVWQ